MNDVLFKSKLVELGALSDDMDELKSRIFSYFVEDFLPSFDRFLIDTFLVGCLLDVYSPVDFYLFRGDEVEDYHFPFRAGFSTAYYDSLYYDRQKRCFTRMTYAYEVSAFSSSPFAILSIMVAMRNFIDGYVSDFDSSLSTLYKFCASVIGDDFLPQMSK